MVTAVEELKQKLELEEAERNRKIEALKGLDTQKLVNMLPEYEEKLEAALRSESSFRGLNVGYLSTGNADCAEVKRLMAELIPPPVDGKKATVTERDNWLVLQRTQNADLSAAIGRQNSISFELENSRITIEIAKKKLENVHRVLALKTAQIQFLTRFAS